MPYSGLETILWPLLVATLLGLLVGSERGWHERRQAEGQRPAGIRTFALVGLLGGVLGVCTQALPLVWALLIATLVFLALAAFFLLGYWLSARADHDHGLTTEMAALLTYWLGLLAGQGALLPAAMAAVIVTLILHLKQRLHRYLAALQARELLGTLQLLLIAVVVLPLLPDQGFGPWAVLNPRQIGWLVVLMAGLSWAAYFAMRLVGTRRGVLLTSLLGGLFSSTALTLSLARWRSAGVPSRLLATGILTASGMMFLRLLIVIALLGPELLPALWLPLLAAGGLLLAMALVYGHGAAPASAPQVMLKNPFQLWPALQFAGLLTLILLGSEALQHWLGTVGLYLLSFLAGLSDVDALTLSMLERTPERLTLALAAACIALAAVTNTLVKGVLAGWIGGRQLGALVLWPMFASALLLGLLLL